MATKEVLIKTLRNADNKPFQKYKGIINFFDIDDFSIIIDDVQTETSGNSPIRVRVSRAKAGFPEDLLSTHSREVAVRDLIARKFWEATRMYAKSPIAGTYGGSLSIPRPGQEVLERSSVIISPYFVEVRLSVCLPSSNKCVAARAAEELFTKRLASIVADSMFFKSYKQSKIYNYVETAENADSIRSSLDSLGLAAFIAEGSIIPRAEDALAPMQNAIPFSCPSDVIMEIKVPNGEPIRGLGIKKAFTVITGTCGQGKTTLIDALHAGVYNHIPGDGREYVISAENAVMIVSEKGRPSDNVDISSSIKDKQKYPDSESLTSEGASATLSEFIAISEAVEMGASLLIFDEGTSERSVLVNDAVLEDVAGESGYVSVSASAIPASIIMASTDGCAISAADQIIVLKNFTVDLIKSNSGCEKVGYNQPLGRQPMSHNIIFEKGRKEVHASPAGVRSVEIGPEVISVPSAGLFDRCQTAALARSVILARDKMDGTRPMREIVEFAVKAAMEEYATVDKGAGPDMAQIRAVDLAAVLNRHMQLLVIR